jgi:hypothetical protein
MGTAHDGWQGAAGRGAAIANTNPPKRAQAWSARGSLEDIATPGRFKSSPTLATGDFKLDKDGGGLNNMGTLPSVSPAATKLVLYTLDATEMTADLATILGSDATTTPEWPDHTICIQTTA